MFGTLTVAGTSASAAGAVLDGDDFTVTDLGGTYEVVLDLDSPLPMRSDAPTLIVDGEAIGLAQQSADGKSLSVLTSDPGVSKAKKVQLGWFSEGNTPAGTSTAVDGPTPEIVDPQIITDAAPSDTPDPADHGTYAYTKSIYSFGNQAIALAGIGGIRGEVEGKIYLPTTGGARPVVLLLHGRHTSCNGSGANPLRWPCGPTQTNIPSYAGYDGTAEALASNGYAVLSIAANAINSNDNELALDQGAQARGQLILDTLGLFQKATNGEPITLHDAQTDTDVTLADALDGNGTKPAALIDPEVTEIAPADLVGRLDFRKIGLMGHSRGGEGVTSAATLNNALAHPFDIVSILPLAPVDFGRMTVPNIPTMVVLPYCDGDVSNQQGQHMNDDARYAFDDDVLRSNVWVMGANHNFFNTVWTPGKYALSVSDDWSGTSSTSARATDSVCGTAGAATSTSIRLTADQQYDIGTSLMSGFFRLTVGGEQQFLPMFDGSGAKVDTTLTSDVRVMATQPASARADIQTFAKPSTSVRIYGTATATHCASLFGRTLAAVLPYCSTTLASAQVPHWTPASNGANVPATPVTRMAWTSGTGEVRLTVPKAARDASVYTNLSLKLAADETVAIGGGTDLTLTVVDGSGATFSKKVSELNANALNRMPQSTQNPTTLGKVVLQQVNLPVADMTGVDTTDLREVRLTAAVGIDGLVTGGAYLSDLAFDRPSLGSPQVKTEVAVGTARVAVEEGKGPGEAYVPVLLSAPATVPVTAFVTVAGGTTATSKAAVVMEKVTFAPGEVCKPVTVATYGDSTASAAASTAFKISVTNTSNAVMGANAFAQLVVREDDGVTGTAVALPAVGVQGDPCAELAPTAGTLTTSEPKVAPEGVVTVTGTGFRSGESVAFTLGGVSVGSGVAAADGTVTFALTVPADTALGATTVSAVSAGTGRTASGPLSVLATTATALTITPEVPSINQPVTLTAAVTGATTGTVTFVDGTTTLGTSELVDGVATLEVPAGFKAGTHPIVATFGETATAQASSSNVVSFSLVKGASSIALALSSGSTVYGTPVTGIVAVANTQDGAVKVTYGSATTTVQLSHGAATFTVPGSVTPGSYAVTATFLGTDTVDASGTASASLVVAKKATTSALTAPAKVTVGGAIAGTVTVGGSVSGTFPTGSVKVYVKKGTGAFTLAKTVAVTAAAKGKVAYSVVAPTTATALTVKAEYSGDGSYGASSAAPKSVTVAKKATTAKVTTAKTVKVKGKLTGTVTIGGATAGTYPTGTVKVYERQAGGSYKLATTVTLKASAKGKVTFAVTAPTKVGTAAVKVVYGGSGTHSGSSAVTSVKVVR
ncbi:Ig-like domain-containing protein [Cellulomonas sp. PhB150]|uniref:Ig-like domain-containing protein n=1 Tax=Cellulomonas sp. PhB150 TaxID=2485188 RepID=UPI000F48079C|nr:Ig-like domain-containing protein [Cellulomonas sp. PhB150]ROS22937.1 Ig-like domain-containing protein [Cellulomonas sp. PhB150]